MISAEGGPVALVGALALGAAALAGGAVLDWAFSSDNSETVTGTHGLNTCGGAWAQGTADIEVADGCQTNANGGVGFEFYPDPNLVRAGVLDQYQWWGETLSDSYGDTTNTNACNYCAATWVWLTPSSGWTNASLRSGYWDDSPGEWDPHLGNGSPLGTMGLGTPPGPNEYYLEVAAQCEDDSGSITTVSTTSSEFAQSDETLPEFTMPGCPSGTTPEQATITEVNVNDPADTSTPVQWLAPSDWSDFPQCTQVGADCALALNDNGVPCQTLDGSGTADCSDYPGSQTADPSQYTCTWGTYSVQLSDCDQLADVLNGAGQVIQNVQRRILNMPNVQSGQKMVSAAQAALAGRQCYYLDMAADPESQGSDCVNRPIFFPGSDTQTATLHDYQAIMGGSYSPSGSVIYTNEGNAAWTLLNKHNTQNVDWYAGMGYCANVPSDSQCDEYPFQSSQQGGPSQDPPTSLRPVITHDNSSQGGYLTAFYGTRQCNLQDEGAPYMVVPLINTTQTPGVSSTPPSVFDAAGAIPPQTLWACVD